MNSSLFFADILAFQDYHLQEKEFVIQLVSGLAMLICI
jgi:hypothetical protein